MKANVLSKGLKSRAQFYAQIIVKLYTKERLAAKVMQLSRGARHLSLGVRLADPTNLAKAIKLAEPIALGSGSRAVIAQRDLHLIRYQFQLAHDLWEYYTRADVTGLTVGLGENRHPIEFSFSPPHALIAGTTDSGKTETVKSILIALMTTHTPDELKIAIVDPHADYAAFENEAHLASPIGRTAQEIDQLLTWAGNVLAHRMTENIRDGWRLVIAIEEAEAVLSDETRLTIAQRIAAEGRKFKVNLLIASQKPTQKSLPDLVHLLNNKWIGLVDNAQISAYLTGQAGLECHKLTGQGDFIHIIGAEVSRLQVALATSADFDRLERAELRVPELDHAAEPLILNLPVEKAVGRPQNQVDPKLAALYFFNGPHTISIKQAKEILNLSRRRHDLHREFILDFAAEYLRLRKARLQQ
jgi:hypothetical protein